MIFILFRTATFASNKQRDAMKTEPVIIQSRLSAIAEDLKIFAAEQVTKRKERMKKSFGIADSEFSQMVAEQTKAEIESKMDIDVMPAYCLDRASLATLMAERCKSASPSDYDIARLDFLRIRELTHYCQVVADYCPEEADGVAAYLANSVDSEHVALLSPCKGREPKPGGMIVFHERFDYSLWNLFDDSRLRLVSVQQSQRWSERQKLRAGSLRP